MVAVGLAELADPGLDAEVDAACTLPLGAFEALIAFMRDAGVRDVVLAGKVPKSFLWERPDALQPDALALRMMAGLADRADDSLLGAFVDGLEGEGLHILPQTELGADLLAPRRALGKHAPNEAQWADIAWAWPIARTLGAIDVGQSVVVQGRAVLALEAIEGTDEAIRRGCALGTPGACVVKVAKPGQDPRFDVPGIGPDTVRALAAGGGAVLAVEAGATFVVAREELVAVADDAGIAVVGVSEADVLGSAPS